MPDYIVSVMARDRAGIVAGVSSALYDLGANITHLNQTVVRGYFTIILSASLPEGVEDRDRAPPRRERGQPGRAAGRRGTLCAGAARGGPAGARRSSWPSWGRDRPGIIARVTGYLAEQGDQHRGVHGQRRRGQLGAHPERSRARLARHRRGAERHRGGGAGVWDYGQPAT